MNELDMKTRVIRTIQTVKNGQILLDLPSELSGKEVEVIILIKDAPKTQRRSLRGALQNYARPELIDLESSAWENAIEEKYGDRYISVRFNFLPAFLKNLQVDLSSEKLPESYHD